MFLNQSKINLEKFKYPLISFSNYILKEKYKFKKHIMEFSTPHAAYRSGPLPADKPAAPRIPAHEEQNNAEEYAADFRGAINNTFPFMAEYPEYITTYTSASFIVSKENIRSFPLHFYEQLRDHLFTGRRTCGYLEYVWTTMWGGAPFATPPDVDRSCGPLFHTDISPNRGFQFFASDDGSVEEGKLPDGYHGKIMLR